MLIADIADDIKYSKQLKQFIHHSKVNGIDTKLFTNDYILLNALLESMKSGESITRIDNVIVIKDSFGINNYCAIKNNDIGLAISKCILCDMDVPF